MIGYWRWPIAVFPLLLFGLLWPQQLPAVVMGKGVFLIASKKLADPRFHEGVILLIQHDDQGSAGLVVNRSSRLALTDILPEGSKLAAPGKTLSYGGPVEPQTLIALVQVRRYPPEPADQVMGSLYVTGVGILEEWPEFAGEVLACRTFSGYSGWAPGQLEEEIKRGDWHVLPADEESVFAGNGQSLWERLQKTFDKRN